MNKKRMKNRTKFTIVAIINIIWYTVVCLIAAFMDKSVPDTLTTAWFRAWIVELALLAGITIKGKE